MYCSYKELINGKYFCNLYYKVCVEQCKFKIKKGLKYE